MASYPRLLEDAVEQMATLPGIGKKTALRLVLSLLNRSADEVHHFSDAFIALKEGLKECKTCHNISEQEECDICRDASRSDEIICVVQDIRDVISIENTRQFKGRYHVLGGLISPMDGVGPDDLNIASLIERVSKEETQEVLLALSATMEGDTTNFYLYRKLQSLEKKITTLARGVAVGDDLEYADELTLGRSIENRTPYEASLSK